MLDALYQSLSQRRRPEDVADMIRTLLGEELTSQERAILDRAANGALRQLAYSYTSMLQEFAAPVGLEAQIKKAKELFATRADVDNAADPAQVEAFMRTVGPEIKKVFGQSDFQRDRLNARARDAAGLDLSRRKYNRKFRILARMEKRLGKLVRELRKFDFTRVGKSGLATRLPREEFMGNASSACFIAYLTARGNLRSEFTVWGQQRAFDEIAEMLLARCRRDPGTNWFAIAHVYPKVEVLKHLYDGQKGRLLATWHTLLTDIASLLEETWERSRFNLNTMVVRRGDDSTTWNNTASAWNKARDGWMALVYAMGMEALLDSMCVGKVMRLMAADVVAWHRNVGHTIDPNTRVWADLPLPWEVLQGRETCSRSDVVAACGRHGVDPHKSGWIAPRPQGAVATFRPTPELVHGVTVGSPVLATILRKAGWFSGKPETLKPVEEVVHAERARRSSN